MPEKQKYRGGRERHIILWVANIRKYFPAPFFRNEWKEEFLEECWQEDQVTLNNVVGNKRRSVNNMLATCPRTANQKAYATACSIYKCKRQKPKGKDTQLDKFKRST
jgi:hypothetical protein